MKQSKLFAALPSYVATPDGMAIDADGNLVLACPNYADQSLPGCILKISKEKEIQKLCDLPTHPETGLGSPMGIAFGPDGSLYVCDNQGWPGRPELIEKGRILRLFFKDGRLDSYLTVATGMEHPNGMRIKDGFLYVTQSTMNKVKDPSGLLVSAVYRFALEDREIEVTNTLADPNIFTTFLTHNKEDQYGVDGIEFDKNGDLLVGNFGDGTVYRVVIGAKGEVISNTPWVSAPGVLVSTDGMIMDEKGDLYIADFCGNAIVIVHPDATVERLAESPDCTGLEGGLDQPGEPILWNGRLIASCFDLVTGGDNVNTGHERPATLAEIEL